MIKRMIDAEDPRKPLSDAKLTAELKAQGITLARRTVAKYREAMNVPSSNERQRVS
jgi:RNA polymerase sigma-54 factor